MIGTTSHAAARAARLPGNRTARAVALGRACLALRHEDVALPPDGLDVARLGRIGLDQTAQAPDRHVEAAVAVGGRVAAQPFVELGARDDRHLVLDEDLERSEFAGTQRHALAVAAQFARREVHFERAEAVRRTNLGRARRHRALPAQHRADARHQLARIEGLGQIVVGAQFETHDAVDHVGARGEKDDRNVVARGTQLAQRGDAVLLGHHDVEHDDGRPLHFEAAFQARAVVQHGHREAVALQVFAHEVAHYGVVVDEQHMFSHATDSKGSIRVFATANPFQIFPVMALSGHGMRLRGSRRLRGRFRRRLPCGVAACI
ncbi:protein of unknown function [Paraburkholderia kururiensis]